MQWILQKFEDTSKLADALARLGIEFTWHTVVPFEGTLVPDPVVTDPNRVVLFGSYSLWRTATERNWRPGVFKIGPFIEQSVWKPYLLNGGAERLLLSQAAIMPPDDEIFFVRPVDDSKEMAGTVMTRAEIVDMSQKVMSLKEDETPIGSLRHDTELLLATPTNIQKEWRCWIVDGNVVTWSLYKQSGRVVYKDTIDDDALEFARAMSKLNPDYSRAYVMDICRTDEGLRIIETNCINAAGFYAADLQALALAIDAL